MSDSQVLMFEDMVQNIGKCSDDVEKQVRIMQWLEENHSENESDRVKLNYHILPDEFLRGVVGNLQYEYSMEQFKSG